MRVVQHGFTLLELMVTLLVAGVLVGLAIPSFQETLARNQIAVQVNSFLSALNIARSEAIKRGLPVAVRARNATADNEWGAGWCVIAGNPVTLNCDSDEVIEQFEGFGNADILNSPAPANDQFIQFNSRGGLLGANFVNVDLCPEDPIVGSRRIQVSFIGRSAVYKETETDTARQPACNP